jgi:DedD protein
VAKTEQSIPQSVSQEAKPEIPASDKPAGKKKEQKAIEQAARPRVADTASEAVKSSQINGPTAWVVQVGSFGSRENAVQLQNKLRKHGFSGFVESFMKDGALSHRVRIGPEIDRTDAEKILQQIKTKLALNGIVVSYP